MDGVVGDAVVGAEAVGGAAALEVVGTAGDRVGGRVVAGTGLDRGPSGAASERVTLVVLAR
ncbi:MAG: hypothetical protein ACRDYC_08725 [Acidimicrobiales bacterium]